LFWCFLIVFIVFCLVVKLTATA